METFLVNLLNEQFSFNKPDSHKGTMFVTLNIPDDYRKFCLQNKRASFY